MRQKIVRAAACAAAAAALFGAIAAEARPRPDLGSASAAESSPPLRVAQRGGVSLQEATAIALQRFPGRVVSAETIGQGGRQVHVIRIIGEGNRVRTVRIDAQTGQFI